MRRLRRGEAEGARRGAEEGREVRGGGRWGDVVVVVVVFVELGLGLVLVLGFLVSALLG